MLYKLFVSFGFIPEVKYSSAKNANAEASWRRFFNKDAADFEVIAAALKSEHLSENSKSQAWMLFVRHFGCTAANLRLLRENGVTTLPAFTKDFINVFISHSNWEELESIDGFRIDKSLHSTLVKRKIETAESSEELLESLLTLREFHQGIGRNNWALATSKFRELKTSRETWILVCYYQDHYGSPEIRDLCKELFNTEEEITPLLWSIVLSDGELWDFAKAEIEKRIPEMDETMRALDWILSDREKVRLFKELISKNEISMCSLSEAKEFAEKYNLKLELCLLSRVRAFFVEKSCMMNMKEVVRIYSPLLDDCFPDLSREILIEQLR